jgi:hypothetical protein
MSGRRAENRIARIPRLGLAPPGTFHREGELLAAEVQRAERRHAAAQRLQRRDGVAVLLVLARQVPPLEVEELGPQEADRLGPQLQRVWDLVQALDVGADLHPDGVTGGGRTGHRRAQPGGAGGLRALALAQTRERSVVRVDDHLAPAPVDNDRGSGRDAAAKILDPEHVGQSQCSHHDRRV